MTTTTTTTTPLSPKEEKEKIKECFVPKMKDGQDWCVIDFKWYLMWQQYVDFDGDGEGDGQRPGPMDNSSLLTDPADTGSLKQELRENYDYSLVPKTAFDKFVQWYGAEPKIVRQVVSSGGGQNLRVDLYPLRIYWKKHGTTATSNPTVVAYIGKNAKVRELKFKLASRVMMPPHKVRLWAVEEDTKKLMLLDDELKPLSEYMIEDGDHFVVEIKNNDDKWPIDHDQDPLGGLERNQTTSYVQRPQYSVDDGEVPVGTVTYSSANPTNQAVRSAAAAAAVGASYGRTSGGTSTLMGMSYRERFKNTEGATPGPGLCGLNNLGNTCFMNSALQCLSNTVPLTNYFLTDEFVKDVNRTNPLGMKGLLADHYSVLLKQLWSGKFRVVAPVLFKDKLGKFAPQFSGYQQHDSQELLAFLLDGLHEDLNRVLQKPYVETVESNGRPDEVVAAEAWEAHQKRNKSVIVDLFQGQFKSTVICPACDKVSITFDPFMYLSVPLPITNETVLLVSCIYLEQPPVKYALKLPKNGNVTDIKKAMAAVTPLGIEQMGICDIYNHKIFKILPESHPVKLIKENDEIFCFEIVANDDRLPPEKAEIRKRERKAAKLAKKAAKGEKPPEPMDTDEPSKSSEPADVEMQDRQEKEEPEKDAEEKAAKEKEKEKGKKKKKDKPYLKYISVLHRELKPNPMRKNRKYELFGFPFVLSVDPAFTTNRQIYEMIWHHVQQIYKKGEVPPEDPQAAQEKKEKIEQLIKEKEKELSEEEIRGLRGVEPYPFTIFLGTNTYTATPMKEVPLNDEIHGSVTDNKFHFCLDWTDEGIEKYYNKAKFATHESVALLKQEESKAIPLAQCLELFTKKEKLSAEDAWYCSKCQEHREASKKFDVWRLPKILVVHLKRFQFTKYWRDKIETLVDFPEELDMTAYVSAVDPDCPPIYSLYAVSNHSGSMGFGHYTAYAKNRQDGKWYHFNDGTVSEASQKEIVSQSAYLLFYVRKDVENVPYAPFQYSAEEVEAFIKKAQDEIDAEREKEREKERARYGMAGTTSSRAGRPSSLDDIDMHGPHLPAGDPMDTDTMHTAATVAGAGYPAGIYDPREKESPLAGDPTGLRARRNVPGAGAGAAAVTAAVGNVAGDPAEIFRAATAGLTNVPRANLSPGGPDTVAPIVPGPNPSPSPNPNIDAMQMHDKSD